MDPFDPSQRMILLGAIALFPLSTAPSLNFPHNQSHCRLFEAVGVGRSDDEAAIANVAAVQVGGCGWNADARIGRIAVTVVSGYSRGRRWGRGSGSVAPSPVPRHDGVALAPERQSCISRLGFGGEEILGVGASTQVVAVDDGATFADELQVDGGVAHVHLSDGATVAVGVHLAQGNGGATGEEFAESCGGFWTLRGSGFRSVDAGHANGDVGSVLVHGKGVAVAYGDDGGGGAIGWGGLCSGGGCRGGWRRGLLGWRCGVAGDQAEGEEDEGETTGHGEQTKLYVA